MSFAEDTGCRLASSASATPAAAKCEKSRRSAVHSERHMVCDDPKAKVIAMKLRMSSRLGGLLLGACIVVGCGGGNSGGSDPSGGSAGESGAGSAPVSASSPAAAFVGRYQATWSSVATFSSPAGTPPVSGSLSGVITVTALDDADVLMAWQVEGNAPSGTITFAVTGDHAIAVGSATGGSCWVGQLPNGSSQTSCATTASASIEGNTLTQPQTGTFTGTTAQGIAYSGTYGGTWTGTRIP
jgi:hypothetical protein